MANEKEKGKLVWLSVQVPEALAKAIAAIAKKEAEGNRSSVIRRALRREIVVKAAGKAQE